jgi:hypothetical protein
VLHKVPQSPALVSFHFVLVTESLGVSGNVNGKRQKGIEERPTGKTLCWKKVATDESN